jgi:hypothetical protein
MRRTSSRGAMTQTRRLLRHCCPRRGRGALDHHRCWLCRVRRPTQSGFHGLGFLMPEDIWNSLNLTIDEHLRNIKLSQIGWHWLLIYGVQLLGKEPRASIGVVQA